MKVIKVGVKIGIVWWVASNTKTLVDAVEMVALKRLIKKLEAKVEALKGEDTE